MSKIVVSVGTYNLLHPGHVSFLKRARSLGDELYIFLDSGERNKKLKGDKAIFSFEERRFILESLECVSRAYHYDGPSKEWQEKLRILTDEGRQEVIFAKAGDYSFDTLNQKEVEIIEIELGGMVVLLNYDEKYSTTKIFEQIQGIKKREVNTSPENKDER